MATGFPKNYVIGNSSSSKRPVIIVKIDGVADLLASNTVYRKIRYGDPIKYGDAALVYGGLTPLEGVRSYLNMDGSSLTISQTIEPEQGRGSVSQLTLAFIDKDQYMTRLLSPGFLVDEILGREVEVFLGYQELAYPSDYFRIYRGYITGVGDQAGNVTLSISDPNFKTRQETFLASTTTLLAEAAPGDTTLSVNQTGDFYQYIQGPLGTYDPAVNLYLLVDDEIMSYDTSGVTGPQTFTVARGARGTIAVDHEVGSSVSGAVQLQDNCVDMILKLLLSGWNGPWKSGIPIQNFVNDFTVNPVAGGIILPAGVDAKRDYGLVLGDFVTISGATDPGNNGQSQIIRFQARDLDQNNTIVTDKVLTPETNSPATLAFRSQYDTYPIDTGLKLTPNDVDVDTFQYFQETFLEGIENTYRFFITDQQSGKTFIESQMLLPLGGYSITRQGKISMSLTRPPLADRGLTILDKNVILNPQSIRPERATNNRKFFNDIQYEYDPDDQGNFQQVFRLLDSDSFNLIQVDQILPIQALGLHADLGATDFITKKSQLLLSRYKRGAILMKVEVNWQIANTTEAGDIVVIRDTGLSGDLQIANYLTGKRGMNNILFEVIGRDLDIKGGKGTLTLVNGVGSQFTDRYGVIAPASNLNARSNSSQLYIDSSFDSATPDDEAAKWDQYIGQPIEVYKYADWSQSATGVLTGIDELNRRFLTIDPPLPFTPSSGFTVTIAPYPDDIDPNDAQFNKTVHCFWSPTVDVVTGISVSSFQVDPSDISKFEVGFPVLVHDYYFMQASLETSVLSVSGDIVTTKDNLGFTPSSGMVAQFLGFDDGGATYRFI